MRTAIVLLVAITTSLVGFQPTAPAGAVEEAAADEHRAMAHPLTIELAAGAVRLGAPLRVVASVEAGWDGIGPATLGVSTPPAVEVVDAHARSFDLLVHEPGTHLVRFSASAAHAVGPVGGYRQAYLVVPATGEGAFHVDHLPFSAVALPATRGVATPPGAAPEGLAPAPAAAFQSRPMPEIAFEDDAAAEDAPGTLSHATFTVRACWNFVNHNGLQAAQRYAFMEVWDQDTSTANDLLWSGVMSQEANANCQTSGAINRAEESGGGNQDVYIRFVACTSASCVRDASNNVYDAFTPVQTVGTQDAWDRGTWAPPTGEEFAWRAYQYTVNAWAYAVGDAGIPTATLTQLYVKFGDGCTFYRLADDEIHLCANGIDDTSPDDVGHEYGHYLMDKLYGDAYWPSPNGAHSFCQDSQNRGLSWAEGYGDFYGPAVDHAYSFLPGTTGDTNYNRPWNGATFSWNMETTACGSANGDDDEWNVATALWDLWDSANDGQDQSSNAASTIHGRVNACNDFSYRDYYDGTGSGANSPSCNWTASACNFVRTASQNRIDFNDPPTSSVTTQGSFAWFRSGSISISASFSDPESCTTGNSVEFRVSADSTCSASDQLVTTDTTSPYSASIAVSDIPDDASVWTCALPRDFRETGAWARSASSIGIDDTPPTATVTTPPNALLVGYVVSWNAADATAGLSGTALLQEQPPLSTTFTTVCTKSVSGASASGTCSRNPTLSGTYCYRLVVNDAAGNSLTTTGTACTLKI